MNAVTVEVIRDDGRCFLIDNKSWKIKSDGLEGFDFVEPEVTSEPNAYGDGSRLVASRVNDKDRTVSAVYKGSLSEKANQREVVRSFFNHKRSYKLVVEYMGMKKACEGYLYHFSLPTANIHRNLELTFTLLCTQPYMLSYDDFAKNIAQVDGGLEFDFEIPEEGTDFGHYTFNQTVIIENDGDVGTDMKVVLRATGPVTNPKLIKDDKFVRIIDTMKSGDEITIDLISKPCKITKNGVNIIGKTDRMSSFSKMAIDVGMNKISYNADDGYNNLEVYLYYNERYLGL